MQAIPPHSEIKTLINDCALHDWGEIPERGSKLSGITTSRPNLWPTHSPILWVLGAIPWR
jgi:hypothetical protein